MHPFADRNCAKCGARVDSANGRCLHCQSEAVSSNTPNGRAPQLDSVKRWLFIGFDVVMLCVVLGVAFRAPGLAMILVFFLIVIYTQRSKH